jgi:hypothetical protein
VFLYIGSGKGFLKKVNLGGPVEGGSTKKQKSHQAVCRVGKNGKYKKSNQKMYFIYYTGVFSYFKNYSPI